MKTIFLALAMLISFFAFSQIESDKPIQLTGSGTDARIGGLKTISTPEDAVNAEAVQNNILNYASASGSVNAFAVSILPAPLSYVTGQTVHFKANSTNTGAVTLNLNGLGVRQIKKNYNQDLTSGDIKNGQLVSVMYDGTVFQMLSQTGTPSGTQMTVYAPAQLCKQTSMNSVQWTFAEMFPTAFAAGEVLNRCFFMYGKDNHTFEFQNNGTCPGTSFGISGGACGTNTSSNLTQNSTWSSVYMDTGGCISGISSAARPRDTNMRLVCFR